MKLNVAVDGVPFGTNILKVQVPEQLRVKHPSGVKFWDDALGGQGATASSVLFLTGTPGAGKSTLSCLLADAYTGHGHDVIYNGTEESVFQTKLVAERLNLNAGFMTGQESNIDVLLKKAAKVRDGSEARGKQTFVFIDSLQSMDDGFFKNGRITCATAERVLQKICDFAKETYTIMVVIGQVTKDGKAAGGNRLKHMIDGKIHLDVVDKEKDEFFGCRRLCVEKNRFGGSGFISYLDLKAKGFTEIARLGDEEL